MTTNPEFDDYLQRQEDRWGDKFNPGDLAPQFIPFFRTGQRIKVVTHYLTSDETHERTGVVGVTTGHTPTFILLHQKNAKGSSDTLGINDEITAVHNGKTYVPVEAAA